MKINRVLIVDDKEENLYLLQSLLQGHNYEVVTAAHGAEALVKARQNPPDLIISDLLMPVMDGYSLLRHWKADERLKAIPFVVYTAIYTDERDERLALDLGADDFILKPTEPEPFIARINNVLAKVKRGELPPVRAPIIVNPALIKEYDEVLIRKLEQKALQLEDANRALQQENVERKRAEEALLQSEGHLRSVVQTAGDAIVTMDAQGKVRFWNGAAESMFGHLSAEMIGQPLIGVLPERFRGGFQHKPKQPIVTGQLILGQHPVEAIGLRRNGGEFPVEITISSWKEKKETFSTAIIRDITERKHAEEEIRKRVRELEGMNRISTILRTASILEKMLPSLLEETLAIVESDTGAIWLSDPATGTLRRAAARGWMAAMENTVCKLGEGFPGGMFTANQIYVSDEFAHDPSLHALPTDSIPAGWGGACFPIQSEKEVVGIGCIALQLPRKISPEEVNLLVTISEMAGTAIQRTRLVEQTINQLERLSTLHAIDTAINASMDIKVT
ncbi:MAG TPA: response regulator, partial [Anaerolineales bacterium]